MKQEINHFRNWLVIAAVFAALLYLLGGVLMPFVAGMAVAYLLDPLADRLEKYGASRSVAAVLILLAFFVAVAGGLVLLFPLLQAQVTGLIARGPDLVAALRDHIEPLLRQLQAGLNGDALDRLREVAGSYAGQMVQLGSGFVGRLWSESLAFVNMLSLVVITPVVAFYLLRDWDLIVERLDSLLPRHPAPTIRQQISEIDRTIAAFVRGQSSVCLILSLYYCLSLSVVGLQSGLFFGLGAGVVSFIPYMGATLGLAVGLSIAAVQFSEWSSIILVGSVFAVGQIAESYILTPKLVGESVGLHPVWLIFSLLAGGALFGFTGVLLAVPVAAVIGVIVRFSISRYLDSELYLGGGHDDGDRPD